MLLSAELLRRADEALADERLAKDQRRLAAEEVDPSSDEEDERRAGAEEEVVPHDSLVAELRELMLARYLGGKETDINYAVIDADASLDDAWQRTADQDAEDAYFDTD